MPESLTPAMLNLAIPFVNRKDETRALLDSLQRARKGEGSSWLLEGQAGIGKTRLSRWLAEKATEAGFQARWGFCLKESLVPFFPWDQIFRKSAPSEEPVGKPAASFARETSELPSVLLVTGPKEGKLREILSQLRGPEPSLLISRDRPALLRERHPGLPQGLAIRWLSRVEGPENIPPGQIDSLGELIESHFRGGRGRVVGLEGIDYLVGQNNFSSVLSLLQFLRDVAQETEGHLLISLKSNSFEKRENSLLEGLGEVLAEKAEASDPGPPESDTALSQGPAATVMLRFLDRLEKETARCPQLLVLDDLQWADGSSLRAFQFVARNIQNLGVVLVGTYNSEDESLSSHRGISVLTETREDMLREGLVREMTLSAIPPEDLRELVKGFTGLPLGTSLRESELLERMEGNPYFLISTMQMLSEQGALVKEKGSLVLATEEGHGWELPENLRRVVARRLALLGPEELKVLKAGALLGREFELAPISEYLSKEEGSVRSVLRRLDTPLHFVQRITGSEEKWEFSNLLTWEVVSSETPADEARKGTEFLADWWAKNRPQDAAQVARLYLNAHHAEQALIWVRKSLEGALHDSSLDNVEKFHTWLQELLEGAGLDKVRRTDEGCEVLISLIEAAGTGAAPAERIARSLAELRSGGLSQLKSEILLLSILTARNPTEAAALRDRLQEDVAQMRTKLPPRYFAIWTRSCSYLYAIAGDIPRALGIGIEGLGLPEEEVSPAIMATILSDVGWNLLSAGQLEKVPEILNRLGVLAERTQSARVRSYHIALMANVKWFQGSLREAAELWRAWWHSCKESGDVSNGTIALNNTAESLIFIGELDAAEKVLAEVQEISRRFGLLTRQSVALGLSGMVLAHRGRWTEALSVWKQADELGVKTGYAEHHGTYLILRTEGLLHTGNLAKAEETLAELEKDPSASLQVRSPELLGVKSLLREKKGDAPSAGELLREAYREAEKLQHPFYQAKSLALLARWELANGQPKDAKAHQEESARLFERCGVLRREVEEFYSNFPE